MPALFGSMSAPVQQQPAPVMPPVENKKRKNPLFGWLGGEGPTPGINRMQIIGATLKDVGASLDGGGADNLMNLQLLAQKRQQESDQMGWQKEQRTRQRKQWEELDSIRAGLRKWAATLPPGPLADLAQYDPETAYEMYVKQQAKGTDWQVNKYSGQVFGVGPTGQPIVGGQVPNWVAPPRNGASGPQLAPDEEWE